MYNIDINNLSFSYNQENNLILKDINLKVNEGNLYVFLVSQVVAKVHYYVCWQGWKNPLVEI